MKRIKNKKDSKGSYLFQLLGLQVVAHMRESGDERRVDLEVGLHAHVLHLNERLIRLRHPARLAAVVDDLRVGPYVGLYSLLRRHMIKRVCRVSCVSCVK